MRFSFMAEGKASAPLTSDEPGDTMDVSEGIKQVVHPSHCDTLDGVLVSNEEQPERQTEDGPVISDKKLSYSNAPIASEEILEATNRGNSESNADNISIEEAGGNVPVGTINNDVQEGIAIVNAGLESLRSSLEVPTIDSDSVNLSSSNLSVPSEVGSSVIQEPEQQLLQDLEDVLADDEKLHKETVPDEEPQSSVLKKSEKDLASSYQSETHTGDTFMNVGSSLLKTQEAVETETGTDGDSRSHAKDETTPQRLWRRLTGHKIKPTAKQESGQKICPPEVLPSDTKEAHPVKGTPHVESPSEENTATPPMMPAQADSVDNKEQRLKQQKKLLWNLAFAFLGLLLVLNVYFLRIDKEEIDTNTWEEEHGGDGVADLEVSSNVADLEVSSDVAELEVFSNVADLEVSSDIPELEFSLAAVSDYAGINESSVDTIDADVDEDKFPPFSLSLLEGVGVSEQSLNHEEQSTHTEDSFYGEKVAASEETGSFMSKLAQLFRVIVVAMATGAATVSWYKTPGDTSKEVKEESPSKKIGSRPHGNLRKTYQPLPEKIDLSSYSKLRVKDLKQLLASRSLKKSGNKADLIQRLVEAYEDELWDTNRDMLREMLREKEMKVSGLKHELVARLVEAGF